MSLQNESRDIVGSNVRTAVDQLEAYDSAEDCFWAYSTNLEDTLIENGLTVDWPESFQLFCQLWLNMTGIEIPFVHN